MPRHPTVSKELTVRQWNLLIKNYKLIYIIYTKNFKYLINKLPYPDDALSIALHGFMNAVRAYDPNRGKLSTIVSVGIKSVLRQEINASYRKCRCPIGKRMISNIEVVDKYEGNDEKEWLRGHLKDLTKRQQLVLELRMQGNKFPRIGKILKISKQKVFQIYKKSIKTLKVKAMQENVV